MWGCLSDVQRMLAIPALGIVRFAFMVVDMLAAASFGTCSRGCDEEPYAGCEGLLGFTAVLNFFSVTALLLIVLIRWFSQERSYTDAHLVTSILVLLDVGLKLGDIGTPVMLSAVCFPESVVPPFNNSMHMGNCARPTCPVGNLFAMYALYTLLKALCGGLDLVLNTETLVRKPRDWYRLRGTHAR
jgi:hypothetical protein